MPTSIAPARTDTGTDAGLIELLSHSSWVRRLARSLVHDDALADDLMQDAWVAVLRHPPKDGLPPRPWLSQVMRNLVRMRFRGEKRRRSREETAQGELAPADAHLDSPAQLVERVETQRTLAGLVVALEEPLRQTVLLRYYEGLSAADIAARQNIPAGTVRWRLKTGIDKLRAELDRRNGGERQAWLPAVVPLSLEFEPTGGPEGISAAAKTKGVVAMKPLIPVVALIASGVAGVAVVSKPSAPAPQTAASAAPRPVAAPSPAKPAPRLNPEQRKVLLQRIEQVRKPAAAKTGTAPTPAAPTLTREYIRAQIATLLPMLKECYENALSGKPKFDGKLMVDFTITAAPGIGGLVTASTIDAAASTITDVGMKECVQETMYAAQFPAPDDGGELRVSYPFEFRAVDE